MAKKIEATKYYTFTEALGKAIAQAKMLLLNTIIMLLGALN